MANKPESETDLPQKAHPPQSFCGIVMPISPTNGYPDQHWSDVFRIISESAKLAGFESDMVSAANEAGIIHSNIVQNLYSCPVVVCDVSSRNPNVMLELGLRLAFDKAVVLIKDDKTTFSFDSMPLEHLEYPGDLRYQKVLEFQKKLADKIKHTFSSVKNGTANTFLKIFGNLMVPAKIEEKQLPMGEYILRSLQDLTATVNRLQFQSTSHASTGFSFSEEVVRQRAKELYEECREFQCHISAHPQWAELISDPLSAKAIPIVKEIFRQKHLSRPDIPPSEHEEESPVYGYVRQ